MARNSTLAARVHLAWCALVALGCALAFWVPARAACGGEWPAPLDDVFIHFDFARATAAGHPFEWIAGQGYSSGETSPLYGLALALGYAIGFHGYFLCVWAALIALSSVVAAMRATAELALGPWWVAWLVPPILACVGVLDWSLWSGMETAFAFAILARAALSAKRTQTAPPTHRRAAQWALGGWGALLVWTRPEMAVVVAALAVLAARASRTQSPWAALVRAASPGALATIAILALNHAMTGDAQSAGARLKLLSSNPYLGDVDRARELVLNLFYFAYKPLREELAITPSLSWLFFVIAAIALVGRKTRDLAAALLASGALYALLVSWNGAARYQNFRYYAPAVALLLMTACLGVAALARSRARVLAVPIALLSSLGAAFRLGPEIAHFTTASANIHGQQVEMGRRIAARTPAGAIILVGDAGAIPYFSERHAIDALGLGGYHGAPFTDASPHGEAATAEILQRLDPRMRPTHLALYPNWFGAITSHFGREIDHVTIEHNVICGGPTKVLYEADFSSMDGDAPPAGIVLDELDVADVVSERAHAYVSPAPLGGWTMLDVREHVFDGGRVIPEGRHEAFVTSARGEVVVVVRTDSNEARAIVSSDTSGELATGIASSAWIERRAHIRSSGSIDIAPTSGALRDFHVWIMAP